MKIQRLLFTIFLSSTLFFSARGQQSKGSYAQTAQGAAPTAAGGHAWKLHREEKTAEVTDPNTQQNIHMKIMNMLLPDGWKFNVRPGAGIDCAYNDGRLLVAAATQDETTGILIYPAQATFYSTSRIAMQQRAAFSQQWKAFPCTIEQPQSFDAGMHEVATKLMPDGRVLGSIEPVPGLSEQLPQIVAGANANLARSGARISAEAGRLRLSGTFNGKPVEMWMIALQTQRTEAAPGGYTTISDLPLFAVAYAPPGKLDENDRLLMTVLSSVQVDPEWSNFNQQGVLHMLQMIADANATVARIRRQMEADNAAAAAQQAQIRAGAANYASEVRSNVAHNRAAALDHSSQQFALYMGDQAVYKNPATGQSVQLPSSYGHVWASTTGNTNDYILTDSASYDPNGSAGSAGWTQLQMVH